MVNSVSNLPYFSYLGQLQNTTGAAATTTPTSTDSSGTTAGTSASATSSSLVSSLVGKGGYSTSVLSLLQQDTSGSFDPISTLLGGSSADTGLTKLYAGLYDSSAAASLQLASINNPSTSGSSTSFSATSSPIQSLIDNATQTSIAYNQTIQQNAANIVKASEEKTGNITSVIS